MASIGLSERLRLISSSDHAKAIGSDQISVAAGCQAMSGATRDPGQASGRRRGQRAFAAFVFAVAIAPG